MDGYKLTTPNGEYILYHNIGYDCIEGKYKGHYVREECNPPSDIPYQVRQIILLEKFGIWQDEDTIHPLNMKPNRRYKIKGSDEVLEMDMNSKSLYHLFLQIEWMESYADWVDRCCSPKEK